MEHDRSTLRVVEQVYIPRLGLLEYALDGPDQIRVFGAASGYEHRRPEVVPQIRLPRPGPVCLLWKILFRAVKPEGLTDQILVEINQQRARHKQPYAHPGRLPDPPLPLIDLASQVGNSFPSGGAPL